MPKLEWWRGFQQGPLQLNFVKILLLIAEWFYADGQTDTKNLTENFCIFCFERSRNHHCRRKKDGRDGVTRQLSVRPHDICKCVLHTNVSNSINQDFFIPLRYGITYLTFVCVPVI